MCSVEQMESGKHNGTRELEREEDTLPTFSPPHTCKSRREVSGDVGVTVSESYRNFQMQPSNCDVGKVWGEGVSETVRPSDRQF